MMSRWCHITIMHVTCSSYFYPVPTHYATVLRSFRSIGTLRINEMSWFLRLEVKFSFFGELYLFICDQLPWHNLNILTESDAANKEESIALFFKILPIFLRGGQIFGGIFHKNRELEELARRNMYIGVYNTCFNGFWPFWMFVAVCKIRSPKLSCLFVRNCSTGSGSVRRRRRHMIPCSSFKLAPSGRHLHSPRHHHYHWWLQQRKGHHSGCLNVATGSDSESESPRHH